MKIIFTLLLAGLTQLSAIAQTTVRIAGVVKDEQSNAIQSATVSLLRAKDSGLVKVAISGSDGQYELVNIKPGK
jgi:hypothetical protein